MHGGKTWLRKEKRVGVGIAVHNDARRTSRAGFVLQVPRCTPLAVASSTRTASLIATRCGGAVHASRKSAKRREWPRESYNYSSRNTVLSSTLDGGAPLASH